MVVFLGDWLKQIPMAALVAVMIMVSIGTFSWDSLRNLKKHPLSTNIVMVVTVVVVVATHNLAFGVLAGVLLAAMFFANKVGHYMAISSSLDESGEHRSYNVTGRVLQLGRQVRRGLRLQRSPEQGNHRPESRPLLGYHRSCCPDKVVIKFRREGTEVEVLGLNEASATIVDRFGVHDKPDAIDQLMGH